MPCRLIILLSLVGQLLSRAATAPTAEVIPLTPKHFQEYNSSKVQLSYGPFQAPYKAFEAGMKKTLLGDIAKPCSDCIVTSLQADLVYVDGSYANANTGMWLHHTVLYNKGASDTFCPGRPQRFFASGNERTPVDLTVNGTKKAGYRINDGDEWGLIIELMNEADVAREALLKITYEYVPGNPESFAPIVPIWLDVGKCSNSDMPARPDSIFAYTSDPWKSNFSGQIVFTGGHLHDGGTNIEILQNGHLICDSVAGYGLSPGFIDGNSLSPRNSIATSNEVPEKPRMVHISNMTTCSGGSLASEDALEIKAHYDTTRYTPMLGSHLSLEPVMGIAMLYVANGSSHNKEPSPETLLDFEPDDLSFLSIPTGVAIVIVIILVWWRLGFW